MQDGIQHMMKLHGFGKTGMQVSTLGLGGHELDFCSEQEADWIIRHALEAGLNVIDTAECYGESEERIGKALGSLRENCYLFTKCGHGDGFGLPDWSPQVVGQSIERSLRRLRTDYLDLVLLHSCSLEVLQQGQVIESLQREQKAGKVRYIGYSGDRAAARFAASCGAFNALEMTVNIADQEAIDEIIPLAASTGLGVIAKRSLANLAWITKQRSRFHAESASIYSQRLKKLNYDLLRSADAAALALRFTISVPGVDIAIVGTTNPEHIESNISAVEKGPLSPQQFKAIHARWRAVTWWRKPLPGGRLGWHAWI